MSTVEAPVLAEQNAIRSFLDQCRQMMYWQGFWPDEVEHDLELYPKYFSPRLAHLLVKHRFLRQALRLYRRFNPWFIIIIDTIQVFYLFPRGVYLFKDDNPMDAMENIFSIIVNGSLLAMITTAFFNMKTLHQLFSDLEAMLEFKKIYNKVQTDEIDTTNKLCKKIWKYYKYLLIMLTPFIIITVNVFVLLPKRKFNLREWYPWDATLSPVYEITLFIRTIQMVSHCLISHAILSTYTVAMIYCWSNFKTLNTELENIRPMAIDRLEARQLKELVRLPEDSIVTNEVEHINTTDLALQGDWDVAGPVASNARKIDNLALLRPFQETHVPGSISGGEDMSLGGRVRGYVIRAVPVGPTPRRIDNLALLRPFQETHVPGSISGGEDMSLGGRVRGYVIRAVPVGSRPRRIDNLALLRPFQETHVPGSISGGEDMSLGGRVRGNENRAVPVGSRPRRIDNLALLRPFQGISGLGSTSGREVGCAVHGRKLPPGPTPLKTENVKIPHDLLEDEHFNSGRSGTALDNTEHDYSTTVIPAAREETVSKMWGDYLDVQTRANMLQGFTAAVVDQEMEKVLAENIEMHSKILRFYNDSSSLISLPLAVFFIANKFLLGLAFLNVIESSNLGAEKYTPLFVAVSNIAVNFVVNNLMQLMSDQHEAVCKSVYSCDWLEASPSFKKSMLVIMSRANVPLEVKPTGLPPLSRKNFAQVLYSAYEMFNSLSLIVKRE